VPHAFERDRELRDKGLVSLFLESQGAADDTLESFTWSHWPGFDAPVSTSTKLPIPDFRGLPHAALIGVDGTLLWEGSPSDGEKPVREKLDAELAKVQKGWGPTAEVKKVRAALYGKGNLAEARKQADAITDLTLQAELRKEVDAAYARRTAAIKHAQEEARWSEAKELTVALQKSTAGVADWQTEITGLLASFDTPEAKKELAIDDKRLKLVRALREGKPRATQATLPGLLQPLVKAGPDTKAGQRLQKLIDGIKATAKE